MPINQNKIPVISKQFDDSLAVWFRRSGKFILLKPPATEVFQLLQNGENPDKIKIAHFKKFGLTKEEHISAYISEISNQIRNCNVPVKIQQPTRLEGYPTISQHSSSREIGYKMNEKHIAIQYGTNFLLDNFHPLFAHLKLKAGKRPDIMIELTETSKMLTLKSGDHNEQFQTNELTRLKGALMKFLYSVMYDKQPEQWMMTVHASGVARNNQAVLFVAESGFGKSTLTAILNKCGYSTITDDFTAVCKSGKAYPFPAAISVKQGAVKTLAEYYPEIQSFPELKVQSKQIRYIPNECALLKPLEIKAVVFLRFLKCGKFIFEPAEKETALTALLGESWINPTRVNIKKFFKWFSQTDFYFLQYSANQQAIRSISEIFNS